MDEDAGLWLLVIYMKDAWARNGTNHLHRLFDTRYFASMAARDIEEILGNHTTEIIELAIGEYRCPYCRKIL